MLRQLLVPQPSVLHALALANPFYRQSEQRSNFCEETYGRSQECEKHIWFLDSLPISLLFLFLGLLHKHIRLSEDDVCMDVIS